MYVWSLEKIPSRNKHLAVYSLSVIIDTVIVDYPISVEKNKSQSRGAIPRNYRLASEYKIKKDTAQILLDKH